MVGDAHEVFPKEPAPANAAAGFLLSWEGAVAVPGRRKNDGRDHFRVAKAGEFLTAFELTARGFDVSVAAEGLPYDLVAQIAGRKMPLRQSEAVQTLASLTGDNTLLACFRHGLQGAEYWSEHRYVPARDSLYDAITSNAFI